MMRKFVTVLLLLCLLATTVYADGGQVTYSGDAGDFIFAPGSDYSLTDLFPNFKGVMPGDSLTQTITVKNDASKKVKVKIYIRSLGAYDESVDFLSQLKLTVSVPQENEMAYMFESAADQPGQLSDWVCLGTLYSGGSVDLNVRLDVPVTLGNEFQEQVGYLDWQFMVEEFPVSPDDPKPPQTGDMGLALPVALMAGSLVIIFFLLLAKRKKDREEDAYA